MKTYLIIFENTDILLMTEHNRDAIQLSATFSIKDKDVIKSLIR